jgi:hypothetical protein
VAQSVAKAGTVLHVNPVIVFLSLIPLTPHVGLGPLSATLTTTSGTPIVGQTVVFGANPTRDSPILCLAVTNAKGYATCTTSVTGLTLTILNGGIEATYAGSPNFLPSSGSAGLTEIVVL